MNRLFTIAVPDEAVMNAFFSDSAYPAMRQEHFESAVADTTAVANYERG